MPIFRLIIVFSIFFITGCSGLNTFNPVARAGDTVAISMGQFSHITRDDIQIRITDSNSAVTMYTSASPEIRLLVNAYPDPLSYLVVGTETQQNFIAFEQTWGFQINFANDGSNNWSQTTLIINLPPTMSMGTGTIEILSTIDTSVLHTSNVEVIMGTGQTNSFASNISITPDLLRSLERAPHYEISFSGVIVPYSIQIDMTHTADVDNGGVGRTHVVNPRGDTKSVAWNDDGTNLRVVLLPTKSSSIDDLVDFKFFVAGGITNLTLGSVQGFDINGNPVAVNATITPNL